MYDPFDDHDDPQHEPPPNVRRITTDPGAERGPRRAELRPLHAARRVPPPRRGPDPRVWFIRGSIGIAALAGLWLGLQALFPVSETSVTQTATPAPTPQTADVSAVGAPEPPAAQAVAVAPPAPTAVAQPVVEGDRLPGLPTPDPAAVAQAQPAAPAPAQPTAPAPEPAQPSTPPQAREEAPAQQPIGKPTLEPIPPPPDAQANAQPATPAEQQAQQAAQQAAAAAKPQAPAPKPQAPAPPAAQATGGPFELSASASPVNPISEQARVTVTVRATRGGAPLSGAFCMATVHYRTATARQPDGGFQTNGNGVGSFTLDARNTTYGYYIPVDVTCNARGGAVTARTGFTPVRGGR